MFSIILLFVVAGKKSGLLVVDEVLALLRNGEWHGLSELADRSGLGRRKVELVVDFLCGFDFLECDRKDGRVRLSRQLLAFLRRVEDLEREEAGGGHEKKAAARGAVGFLRAVRLFAARF